MLISSDRLKYIITKQFFFINNFEDIVLETPVECRASLKFSKLHRNAKNVHPRNRFFELQSTIAIV